MEDVAHYEGLTKVIITVMFITISKEAAELTGKHYETIRNYCHEGVIVCRRAIKGRGASPLMIKKSSIPDFMRVRKEDS